MATRKSKSHPQAKSQAELMVTRAQMGEPASSGRLRQLELHRILSSAMHNEGIAYRTLCFTLYGRVRSQYCTMFPPPTFLP